MLVKQNGIKLQGYGAAIFFDDATTGDAPLVYCRTARECFSIQEDELVPLATWLLEIAGQRSSK